MSDTQIYQSLVEGTALPSLSRYALEKGLAYALVQAIAEQNTTVFGSAQGHLNAIATQGMTAMASSYCHRDVRAAQSVGRILGFLPSVGHIPMPNEFESDFVRVWSLAAELDDLTLCDQLFHHAVDLNITPLRFAENGFDAKNDAIRWDVYRHLAQRNELARLQEMEDAFGFLKHTLSVSHSALSQMMSSPVIGIIGMITHSVTSNAWDTYKWLLRMASSTPTAFVLQMVAGVCVNSDPKYLDEMFEVCTEQQQLIFDFFDTEDKSGKSTVALSQLLQHVDNCSCECLQYLVSDAYDRNTTRRAAIAQYAESVMQNKVLSEIVKDEGASSQKLKM